MRTRTWLAAPIPLLTAALLLPAALAGDRARALEKARQAAHAGDAAALGSALEPVLQEDGKAAARGLLELAAGLPPGREGAHWQLLRATAALEDARALDALEAFLRKGEPAGLARDLLFALQGRKGPGHVALFGALLKDEKAPRELRVLACDRLGEAATPEAMDALLRALEKEQGKGSDLERQARATLVALAGEDMGEVSNWKGWWEQHRGQPLPVRREPPPTAPKGGGETVRGTLDPAREGGLSTLTRARGRVLVLRGSWTNYDQIEKVLARLGVTHEVMTKKAFLADMEAALKGTAAVLLNCTQWSACVCPTCKPGAALARGPACGGCDKHDIQKDSFPPAAVERIRAFVRGGGSWFSEDYGLNELLAEAWPEHVAIGAYLPAEADVDWLPGPGQSGHPLLRGVLGPPPEGASRTHAGAPLRGKWRVDAASFAIKVVDPARVQVLLFSPQLKAQDEASAPLAVVFSPGEEPAPAAAAPPKKRTGGGAGEATRPPRTGIVLHVLSHFGKQTARADEFALQNLLVNFLLEAAARFGERAGRR